LSIFGEIVIDNEPAVGPACEDGLAECETCKNGMNIIRPQVALGVGLKTSGVKVG
jgi:hypothetical protein